MGGFTEGYRNKDYSKEGTSNYLNIKAGLDAAGLIPNTTFFVEYSSANLLMDAESTDSKDHDDLSNKDFTHKY